MEEFFRNVSRYPKFLISFSLGVVLTLLSPLTGLLKNRVSAVAVVALFVSALAFVAFTLRAMLGLGAVS
jgi:heme/copper-type cytochrome/quinol oxidase subunit 4